MAASPALSSGMVGTRVYIERSDRDQVHDHRSIAINQPAPKPQTVPQRTCSLTIANDIAMTANGPTMPKAWNMRLRATSLRSSAMAVVGIGVRNVVLVSADDLRSVWYVRRPQPALWGTRPVYRSRSVRDPACLDEHADHPPSASLQRCVDVVHVVVI